MARKHNQYAQLLHPINEQQGISDSMDTLPMTDVPNLRDIANGCASMAQQLNRHAHNLHGMADMQNNFKETVGQPPDLENMQFYGSGGALPGDYYD